MPGEREEQRHQLRTEEPLVGGTPIVRGGPDSIEKLRRHAQRTARVWSLDGQPLLGVSVFAVLDVPLDELLRRDPLFRYRTIYLPAVAQLQGFQLLPTKRRPHYTLRLQRADDPELGSLMAAFGPPQVNPSTLGDTKRL
jgi:hypothetical protein